ncbi:MAG: O-antigen polymerase [Bacteroidota bacterium]
MAYLISLLSLGLIFFARKLYSRYYLTPTGILAATWIIFILLHLLVAREMYFSVAAAVLFVLFIFSFFVGEILAYLYVELNDESAIRKYISKVDGKAVLTTFQEPKVKRLFGLLLLLLGLLSFGGSILYVKAFVNYFGSVVNILTAGWALRGALEEISIPLFTRAILMLGYSAIILSLIYTMVYKQFKWYLLLPYISLLIMGITQAGRAGFIMILFQVFIWVYWKEIFKQVINDEKEALKINPEYLLIKKSFKLILIIVIVFVGGDMLRSQSFSLTGDVLGQGISSFKQYLFTGISAFTSNLNNYNIEPLGWGRFSFSSLYDLLGIHKNQIGIYDVYLRVSNADYELEGNIFTAFRQLMDDFGITGTIIAMIFLGALSHIFFRRAIKGDLSSIAFMIVLYTFLFHTVLLAITVHNGVLISMVFPFVALNFLKKSINLNL